MFQKEWEARWQANRQKCSPVWELFCRLPQRKNLKVFKDLRKAEASLYLQILSARIGLASFLFRANVPDFQSPLCSCGFREETAQHITFSCIKFLTQRQQATFLSYNFSTLLQKPKVLKEFLLWFMSLKKLDQFYWAHQLLPENQLSLWFYFLQTLHILPDNSLVSPKSQFLFLQRFSGKKSMYLEVLHGSPAKSE